MTSSTKDKITNDENWSKIQSFVQYYICYQSFQLSLISHFVETVNQICYPGKATITPYLDTKFSSLPVKKKSANSNCLNVSIWQKILLHKNEWLIFAFKVT